MTSLTKYREHVLKNHYARPDATRRPVLTNLNGDNSWIISFPVPLSALSTAGKRFFHVLQDPWLDGSTGLGPKWFVHLERPVEPGIQDASAIGDAIEMIEEIARGDNSAAMGTAGRELDAIFVSCNLSDYCHQRTLVGFPANIPVFAPSAAAKTIRGYGHFENIYEISDFNPITMKSWKDAHPGGPLPEWLTITHLVGPGFLNFGIAHIFSSFETQHEMILYSPHGVPSTETSVSGILREMSPPVRTLALMHPLKESFSFGIMNVSGVVNGLDLYRKSKAKYWVQTADAELRYSGIVMWFVRDEFRTLQWGLDKERASLGEDAEIPLKPSYIEIENGHCFVLD